MSTLLSESPASEFAALEASLNTTYFYLLENNPPHFGLKRGHVSGIWKKSRAVQELNRYWEEHRDRNICVYYLRESVHVGNWFIHTREWEELVVDHHNSIIRYTNRNGDAIQVKYEGGGAKLTPLTIKGVSGIKVWKQQPSTREKVDAILDLSAPKKPKSRTNPQERLLLRVQTLFEQAIK